MLLLSLCVTTGYLRVLITSLTGVTFNFDEPRLGNYSLVSNFPNLGSSLRLEFAVLCM